MLYNYVAEPDEAPSVFDSAVAIVGFITDDVCWALLLPMDGTLNFYLDKKSYALDKPAKLSIQLIDIHEVKKTRASKSGILKYYFDIYMINGKRHVFYTHHEELTEKWVESIFLAFVYQKSE